MRKINQIEPVISLSDKHAINKYLKSGGWITENKISKEVELLLMLADRKDHVEKTIQPNLLNNVWVISDRFMDSSIAYQAGGRGINIETIEYFKDFLDLPSPNLTLLFDLPVKTALERVKRRGGLDRFEKEDIEFHTRVRDSYLFLAKKNPDRINYGFIAQEVKKAMDKAGHSEFPVWSEQDDGMQELGEAEFITPLIKAVQELTAKVEALENA